MQEALAEKDKALGENDELISGLTRAVSELRQQLPRHPAEKQESYCQERQEENPLPDPEVYPKLNLDGHVLTIYKY